MVQAEDDRSDAHLALAGCRAWQTSRHIAEKRMTVDESLDGPQLSRSGHTLVEAKYGKL
jgi:hypothetical protein